MGKEPNWVEVEDEDPGAVPDGIVRYEETVEYEGKLAKQFPKGGVWATEIWAEGRDVLARTDTIGRVMVARRLVRWRRPTPAAARAEVRAYVARLEAMGDKKRVDVRDGRARFAAERAREAAAAKRATVRREAAATKEAKERTQPVPKELAPWRTWWAKLSPNWKRALRDVLGFEGEPSTPELRQVASIRKLDLYEAEIDGDLRPLRRLTTLESLDVYGTGVEDLRPLAALKKLRTLRVANCTELEDVGPLASLTSLQTLDVSDTAVVDLSPLHRMRSLRTLVVNDYDGTLEPELARFRKVKKRCVVTTST